MEDVYSLPACQSGHPLRPDGRGCDDWVDAEYKVEEETDGAGGSVDSAERVQDMSSAGGVSV